MARRLWLAAAAACVAGVDAIANNLAACTTTPARNVTYACYTPGVVDVTIPPDVETAYMLLIGATGGYTSVSIGGNGLMNNYGETFTWPRGTVKLRLNIGAGGTAGCDNGDGVGGGGGGATSMAALNAAGNVLTLLYILPGGGGGGCCPANQPPLWKSMGFKNGVHIGYDSLGPYYTTVDGAMQFATGRALAPSGAVGGAVGGFAGGLRLPPDNSTSTDYLWAEAPYNVSAGSNGANATYVGPVAGGVGGISAGVQCGGGGGGGLAGGAGGGSVWTPYGKCCGGGGTAGSAFNNATHHTLGGFNSPSGDMPGIYNASTLKGADGGVYFNFQGVTTLTTLAPSGKTPTWPQAGGLTQWVVGTNLVDALGVQMQRNSNASVVYDCAIVAVNYTHLQFVTPALTPGNYYVFAFYPAVWAPGIQTTPLAGQRSQFYGVTATVAAPPSATRTPSTTPSVTVSPTLGGAPSDSPTPSLIASTSPSESPAASETPTPASTFGNAQRPSSYPRPLNLPARLASLNCSGIALQLAARGLQQPCRRVRLQHAVWHATRHAVWHGTRHAVPHAHRQHVRVADATLCQLAGLRRVPARAGCARRHAAGHHRIHRHRLPWRVCRSVH